ncbi:S-adenosyl-L-methionine-dependent methyltransferase [Spinellus fusiger]|nr:S-adenosyl-L-methionine-dependent methyltransferase [Spinellus fusiger]
MGNHSSRHVGKLGLKNSGDEKQLSHRSDYHIKNSNSDTQPVSKLSKAKTRFQNAFQRHPTCSGACSMATSEKHGDSTVIDGRSYQNINTKYMYPNDEEEQDRLIQMHFLLKHLLDGNFSAPVKNILSQSIKTSWETSSAHRVSWATSATSHSTQLLGKDGYVSQSMPPQILDIGCGTGTWVMEMATEYSDAQVHGIDLSVLYPETIKPPNVTFIQGNVLSPSGLPYPDNYFDFVHMQLVYACFSKEDWGTVVKEIKRVLKPGGYVELREMDPVLRNMGPVTEEFLGSLFSSLEKHHNVNLYWGRYLYEYLEHPGEMTDIHYQTNSIGVGWGDTMASMTYEAVEAALHAIQYSARTALSLSNEMLTAKIAQIMGEMSIHQTSFQYYVCWARKPLFCTNEVYIDRLMTNNSQTPYNTTLASNSQQMSQSNCEVKFDEGDKDNLSAICQFVEGYSAN